MSSQLPPRVHSGGDFVASLPRTGEDAGLTYRVRNLLQRGRTKKYWESFLGSRNLDMDCPLVALTGTLNLVQGSATVTGTGTKLLTEAHLGQFILCIDEVLQVSVLLVIKRIVSDTEMTIWQNETVEHPYVSLTAVTGWQMSVVFAVNDLPGTLLRGNVIQLDKGSLLSVGSGQFRLNGVTFTGTAQVETATVVGTIGPAGAGNAKAVVTAAGMTGSPKTVTTAVANNDTASIVAGKMRVSLAADVNVAAFFTVGGTGANIVLTRLAAAANDATMNIATDNDTCTGLTAEPTSVNTTAGVSNAQALLTATREPQISIYNPVTDTYRNYTLGMAVPTGITAAAVGGGSKGMQGGNYSYVVTAGRSATAGYNNPSERIDVTIATNDQIEMTFGAMDIANGSDQWDIWGTTFTDTLGADLNYLQGPWHYVRTVTSSDVSPAGGTFTFEYLDAEIETNEIVSFNNDPPSQAEFIQLINFTPTWLSCRGKGYTTDLGVTVTDPSPGPFIEPAKPNNIEAAPVEIQFASSPPETILGGISAQGRIYLPTPNHLQIAQATPDQRFPVIIRPFWHDGFANPYQLTVINGQVYGFTVSGPAKSVGDGDEIEAEKEWAGDMQEIMQSWNVGQVLTCYDPYYDALCFFHAADHLNDSGFWTTRILFWGLPQSKWIGEALLSREEQDSIVSGVATVGERIVWLTGGRQVA